MTGIVIEIISLVITIIIGALQIWQSKRMSDFEKRQDEREEKRHKEVVDAKVVQFVTKYNRDIGLLPLCMMASMYDRYRPYNREMYLEFNASSNEVQDAILKSQGLRIPRYQGDFFKYCLKLINGYLSNNFKSDNNFCLHDNGKYLNYAIKKYGFKKTEYEMISNQISDAIFYGDDEKRIDDLIDKYRGDDVKKSDDAKFSDAMVNIMYWAAYNSTNDSESDNYDSWIPPYGEEKIDTMEDMFLMFLLATYLKLGLNGQG